MHGAIHRGLQKQVQCPSELRRLPALARHRQDDATRGRLMVTRAQVVECARSYIGTPWHHQARVKGPQGGIDCAGLVICVGEELKLFESVETPNYSRYPDGSLLPTCAKYLTAILSHAAQPGD